MHLRFPMLFCARFVSMAGGAGLVVWAQAVFGQGYLPMTGPSPLRFASSAWNGGCFGHLRPQLETLTNGLSASIGLPSTNSPVAAPVPIEAIPAAAPQVALPPAASSATLAESANTPAEPALVVPPDNEPAPIAPRLFVTFFTSPQPAISNQTALATLPIVFEPPKPTSAPSSSATYTSH